MTQQYTRTFAHTNGAIHVVQSATDTSGSYQVDPDNWAKTLSYTANVLQYEEITDGTNTFRRTYTYTGTDLTGITGWVKQ